MTSVAAVKAAQADEIEVISRRCTHISIVFFVLNVCGYNSCLEVFVSNVRDRALGARPVWNCLS